MRNLWKWVLKHLETQQPDTFEAALRAVDDREMAVAT